MSAGGPPAPLVRIKSHGQDKYFHENSIQPRSGWVGSQHLACTLCTAQHDGATYLRCYGYILRSVAYLPLGHLGHTHTLSRENLYFWHVKVLKVVSGVARKVLLWRASQLPYRLATISSLAPTQKKLKINENNR